VRQVSAAAGTVDGVTGHHRVEQMSAWILVVLGAFLLANALVGLWRAIGDGDWLAAGVIAVLMAVIGLGVLRGARQLQRLRRPAADDGPPDPTG
jgi:hypothetical protein